MIGKLVYVDYLKVIGTKYQTNFFINSKRLSFIRAKYQVEHIKERVEPIKVLIDKKLSEIKAIGFIGNDLGDDKLKWMFISYLTCQLQQRARVLIATPDYPKRKDGSFHFVNARFR